LKLFQGSNFGSFVTKRLCLPLTFLLAAAGLQAASFTFNATSATACGTGNTCNGSAVFNITGTNTFTVTLNNLQTDIKDAAELLTDLYFTLDGSTVSLVGSSGTDLTIDGNGVPTTGTTGTLPWAFGQNTGTGGGFLLCVICGNGVSVGSGVAPAQGIIDVQASYADANGSIAGSPSHNPFVESGATFSFTSSTALNTNATTSPFGNVGLSFGTVFGNEVTTTGGGGGTSGSPAPEPVSMLLTGAGLTGLALVTRRRLQKARV
jgi:hypothetical protein